MDISGIEATQALDFGDGGDETDEDIDFNTPVAYLNVRCQKGFPGKLFPIYEGDNIIGRHDGCQVAIPLKALSREHACIEVSAGSHFIYDKGSRNRTKRNKHFLAAAVRYELKDKDKLIFGDVEAEFQLHPANNNDDGSDTESESMFQTAPADDVVVPAEEDNIPAPAAADDDDGCDSDASCDILQPTQQFAKNTQSTSIFGTKAQLGETTIAQNITVEDTPEINRTKRLTDSIVIPESGSDTEGEEEICKDKSGDISRLMVAETQSYVCESDVTTDDEDNSVDKSSLLVAPTQAFVQGNNDDDDDDDISTCDEASPQKKQLMMAATQAYVDSDDHASPKKKIMFEPTQAYDMDVEPTVEVEHKVGVEPTVHYDMDEGVEPTVRVEPTQAYDMDGEEEEVKTKDEKRPGILFEPTQAYTGYDDDTEEDDDNVSEASESDKAVGFDDPTLAVETVNSVDDESETPVVEEQSEKVGTKSNVTKDDNNEADTQVCDEEVGSKSNVPVNDNETETQICDEVPDESEKSNDNKVEKAKSEKTTQGFDKQSDPTQTFNDEDGDTFDFLATSTLAVDDVDSGESNTSSAKDTADVDFNQPTQVFDNVDETCAVTEDTVNDKPKRKVCSNNEDATQVFNNDTVAVQDDATVAVEDADISKDSKCSSKARKSKISKKQCVPESVPIIDNDGQTQVFDQTVDINEITKVVKPAAKGKAAISASDQPTQVFDETVPVEDMTDVKDSAQGKNDGPTQVFDETVPVEDIQVTTKAQKKTKRATTTKNKGGSEMDQPTQVFDDTLAAEETSVEVKQTRGGKKTKKSARNKKQSAMEDATQVFDETVAVEEITNLKETTTNNANKINSGDQPTQVFDETLPANEIPDIRTNTTNRGKKQAIIEKQIAEDEPTQVFDEPTTSKNEDLKAGEDQTQVFEENVEEAAMVSKPVRKGKRGAKKAQENNASTTEGSTQIFDETVVSQGMQGSEDTESVSEETNVKPGVRKGGRRKQTKTDVANDTVETNNTTRGRGSKSATNRQTESEETTIANENVKESVHPKNNGRNEPTKDTDEVAEQPIDSVRKSGRTKRNASKKDAEKKDDPKVSIENKKGKKKANKSTVETEAATQLYGDEDPTVTDGAATQRYGDDNEEDDLTPDIDTVLAEEANQRNNPPAVETVIPAKSPLKSALASPKKERSPSPKKVQFVSQKSETGSESSQTSRRSNRSNKGKSKYSVDKDASDSKPVQKNSKNKKNDETNSAVDVTTNISENVEEKVPPVRRGRGRRAVQSIDPVQDTETVSDNVKQTEVKQTEVTSKRQGRSKTSDNSSVKNESENMIEETADLTENTSKVIKRGGRKSTNSVGVNQKTRKNTRTSLPTVLEDNTGNNSTENTKTNTRQGNRKGAKRKVEETSDAKNMDDEQNVVADDVKEKPSSSKGSKNKESESVINNEESKGTENDNTGNTSLRPSRRGTRHTESNESTVDNSENVISDKKTSRGKGVKKDVKSDNVKVNESNASEVETNPDSVENKGNSQKGNDSVASKSESDSQVGVNRRGKRNSEVSTSKSDMDTQVQKTQEKGRGNKRSTSKNAGGDADTLNDTTDNKDSSVKKEDEDSKTTKTTGRVKRKGSISSSIDSQESESSGTPAKKQKKGKSSAVSTPVSLNKQPKQLDESITHSPQLRKTTIEGVKAKVMFTGVVDEQGQKIVKELGGELVNAVMDCTHLVTDQVRRTVKFLCCLARGIPIVVPQWLISSKASGFFVDSAPFLVTDDATEKKFKFRLMHSIEKANQERLFEGYTIHVTKSVKPEPLQMKEILNCAGAKYSDKMPSSNASGHTVVISCEEDKSLCTAAVKAGIPVMTAEFVLTGILRQDVDLVSFKLDIDTKGNKRSQPDSESEPAKKRRR